MPDAPDRNIVVLSVLAQGLGEGEAESGDDGVYDVDVAVVSSSTGQVQSRLLLDKAYESDAVRFEGVQIDTARYQLSPAVRAFGLRAEHYMRSGVGGYSTSALSLLIDQDGQMRRVLADLIVSKYTGEWDGQCKGNRTELTRTVTIAPTRSNDFADLLVTTTTTYIKSRPAGDDCKEVVKTPVVTRSKIHFDGKTYPLSNALR